MRCYTDENGSWRPTLSEGASDGMLPYVCSHMIHCTEPDARIYLADH